MKKTIITLFLAILLAPSALAATIVSEYSNTLKQNDVRELAPVIITSTADGDITAEHGIRILLDPELQVLWSEASLNVTGNALNNGKVNLNVQLEYAEDYKSVYIPVMKDFEAGDWLSIRGLTVQAGETLFDEAYLGMDLNGDLVADAHDFKSYRVVSGDADSAELAGLLDYYKTRYSIKCMPSGVAVAENDSTCLWARIDLVYAQEVLRVQDGPEVTLSDWDRALMQTRRRWPEKRYQEKCVETSEPAGYCPALGKALDRISYFLD